MFNDTTDVKRGNPTDELPDTGGDWLNAVTDALASIGHHPRAIGISFDTLDRLETLEADVVLNLCDGTGLDGHPGVEVVAALERSRHVYTGAGPWAYWVTSGKWRTKVTLEAAGVPTPKGAVMPSANVPIAADLEPPLFVKPREAYGSLGVDERSLVSTQEELQAQAARIISTYDTHALVEEYVDGPEISVGVMGSWAAPVALPPLEVAFGRAYDGKPRVRMFATKHDPSSPLYHDFDLLCPAPLEPAVDERVRRVAIDAYRAVECEGYARVDLRLAPDGTPRVLEINTNCSLETGPTPQDSGLFPVMGLAMGWQYPELLDRILGAAFERRPTTRQAPLAVRWFQGECSSHATFAAEAGAPLMPLGQVYPVFGRFTPPGTMRTTRGARVHVEPWVRHLGHSETPNIRVARRDGVLWLEVIEAIAPGDRLTLDRRVPLDLSSRGRATRAAVRAPAADANPAQRREARRSSGRR